MKQHMLNRIISFVLVFVLLVGLLPAGALAANTKDPGFPSRKYQPRSAHQSLRWSRYRTGNRSSLT